MPPVIRRYAIIWRLSSAVVYNVVECRDMFSIVYTLLSPVHGFATTSTDIRNGKHKYVYSTLLYTLFVAHEAIFSSAIINTWRSSITLPGFPKMYASTPSTPVSCWSDSRPSSRAQLEASSRSSEQRKDRPAPQGQQWRTTSPDVWRRSTTSGHTGVTLRSSTTRWRRRRITLTSADVSIFVISPWYL